MDLFTNISADYLASPYRKRMNEPLVTLIHNCADWVLGIEGKSSGEETKTRYLHDIIQFMTRENVFATYHQAIYPEYTRYDLGLPSQDVANLAAAAAAGSLVAVKRMLRKKPMCWPSVEYFDANYNTGVLSDPIGAAACNGHSKVLKFLIAELRPYLNPRCRKYAITHGGLYLHRLLDSIFRLAILSKNGRTIQILAEFANTHKTSFSSEHLATSKANGEAWVKSAVSTGCVNTLQATLSAMMTINPAAYGLLKDHHLALAFQHSCRTGQKDILQYLVAQDRALLRGNGKKGMQLAAQYLHRNIITALLENGISINSGRAIHEAIKYENISIIKFMIVRGARVDTATYEFCVSQLQVKDYKDVNAWPTTSMMPVVFYWVAKVVEQKPVSGWFQVDILAKLVREVDRSELWRGRVEAEFGI
ncbi:hypothetical protein ACET3X_006302 [Alternaria dauci]|uniref:Ankyrin repeat protein n=1 Tax=Alternaria dauci TaxID=48095 RepID=A0ABR3UJ72_9PLEO